MLYWRIVFKNFPNIWTKGCIFSGAAISGLVLISPWVLEVKNFLNFNGELPFLKIFFRIYIFYVIYWQEYPTTTQLLTDPIYKKEAQWQRPMVSELSSCFLWLTNCFRKILWTSYVLLSFVMLFVVEWLSLPGQISNWFLRSNKLKSEPRHCFQLLSNVSYDCEFICFKKCRWIFELSK